LEQHTFKYTGHYTYRQTFFVPNNAADRETREATDPEDAAHRLALIHAVDNVLKGFYRVDFNEAVTGSYTNFVAQLRQTQACNSVVMHHANFFRLTLDLLLSESGFI
jgi:hypothetical protein